MVQQTMACIGLFLGLSNIAFGFDVEDFSTAEMIGFAEIANPINWRVGDLMEYQISVGGLGSGRMVREVTREEGDTVWLKQTTYLAFVNDEVETQLSRADGSILKYLHNGREQAVPEVRKESEDDGGMVTVPAGTYPTKHIVLSSPQVRRLEVWISMEPIVIDNRVKQIANQGVVTLTTELTRFVRNGL